MQKKAIVTGGSRGIGKAIVIALCKADYQVVFCYKNAKAEADKLEALYKNSTAIFADMADVSSVDAFIKDAIKLLKGVDILINNAGVAHFGLLHEMSVEEWDELFAINTRSAFLTSKRVLPSMIAQKRGNIINISSMWGETGASCEVAYSASKGALIAMTKALAKEVGPSNIAVNCISPGVIQTDMISNLSQEDKDILIAETPLQKIGSPEDIAEMVLFLSSSKFITGQVFSVNGGILI